MTPDGGSASKLRLDRNHNQVRLGPPTSEPLRVYDYMIPNRSSPFTEGGEEFRQVDAGRKLRIVVQFTPLSKVLKLSQFQTIVYRDSGIYGIKFVHRCQNLPPH
jgi:hypothetical protein